MQTISVSQLKKHFKVFKKAPGLGATFRSVFSRPTEIISAVDGISFSIEQGELVGFIGPNGAGKTTTLKCLSGLLYPSGGEVKVLGFDPFLRNSNYLKQISLVMGQKNQLWWDLPSLETFRLNKEIYDIPEKDFEKNLDELLVLLEVKNIISTPVRQLSLGQRMKMELIASLIHRPKVLFLDEPTIGLDVVMQKKIRDFIAEYNKRFNATIILTSHYMADVKQLCKRVIIIDHGKIMYDGSLERLVEKYADFKIITAQLRSDKVDKKDFTKLGKINYFEYPKVSITVSKKNIKEAATILLKKFPIEDLTIEEPEIENVIRMVFTKKKT
ncbi:ATP-binding cassette domain-containing protein [Candidatus Gottesmanbacteria bacterium]|nr:ATP-binding cassette domain-containing protein [Candidatus Gottesmanbacteria bacterium]